MKTNDLLLIGGLAAGAYLLYRYFNQGGASDQGGGGGGGGAGNQEGGDIINNFFNFFNDRQNQTTTPNSSGAINYAAIHTAAGSRQSWTNATYGQAGQPSVRFLANTIRAASAPGAPEPVRMAAAAARAGAPPRIVAKFKAGKVY